MSIKSFNGQPFEGYISLTNGAPGPASIPVKVVRNGAAYTLAANERLVITNFLIATNDTSLEKVTITDGASIPTTLLSLYTASTLPPTSVSLPPGIMRGFAATNLVATASAVTSGKTIEVTIGGVVERVG